MSSPRKTRFAVCMALLGCVCLEKVSIAADPSPAVTPRTQPLPGLVSAPAPLAQNGRWQMAYKVPRERIHAIAWSPDGKSVVTNDACYLRIWDAHTWEAQKILIGHTNRITSLDWNRATNRIASASLDGTVRIWSAAGVPKKVLKANQGEINSVAWTTDGSHLAAAASDGTVQIWGSAGVAGTLIRAADSPIYSVAWSLDGKQLVTGDGDYRVKLWAADGTAGKICEGHPGPVTVVAYSADGKHFASMTPGGRRPNAENRFDLYADARIWNTDGSPAATIPVEASNTGMCWSPDGQRLALASMVKWPMPARICNIKGDVEFSVQFPFNRLPEPPLAWSPDGADLVAGGAGQLSIVHFTDGSTRLSPEPPGFQYNFDTRLAAIPSPRADKWLFRPTRMDRFQAYDSNGTLLATMPPDVEGEKLSKVALEVKPAWNPAEDTIAFVESNKRLRIWTLGSKATRFLREFPQPLKSLAWNSRGDSLLVLDQAGMVRVLHPDGKLVFEHAIQTGGEGIGPVDKVRFSANGEKVAVAGQKGNEILRGDGTVESQLPSEVLLNGSYTWFWWSNDGNRLIRFCKWGRGKYRLVTWELPSGNTRATTEFGDEIDAADCSPDGRTLLLGLEGGSYELHHLDAADSSPQTVTVPLGGRIQSVAWSPDGKRFATGGQDALIRIWSPDGTFLLSLFGNNDFTNEVAWTSDAKRLISISNERSMRLWNADSGRQEMSLHPIIPNHYALLTPNGHWRGLSDDQISQDFLYLLEQPAGTTEVVSYGEFRKRTGQSLDDPTDSGTRRVPAATGGPFETPTPK